MRGLLGSGWWEWNGFVCGQAQEGLEREIDQAGFWEGLLFYGLVEVNSCGDLELICFGVQILMNVGM